MLVGTGRSGPGLGQACSAGRRAWHMEGIVFCVALGLLSANSSQMSILLVSLHSRLGSSTGGFDLSWGFHTRLTMWSHKSGLPVDVPPFLGARICGRMRRRASVARGRVLSEGHHQSALAQLLVHGQVLCVAIKANW